jgi:feruloyl esterase
MKMTNSREINALTKWARVPALALAAFGGAAAYPAVAQQALPVVTPVQSCAALASVDLEAIGGPGSRVSSATETTQNGIAVCLVEGTLAPSIGFQVLLPTATWTQRYLQVGCGGLCGRITLGVGAADGCASLTDGGFVLAATDMGHQGPAPDFGQDPRLREDFAHRAQHLTAEAAKALIAAFYGQPQQYAYFSGCSDGGREALVEAQRYPDDFDGVIAGAPAMNFSVQNSLYHGWMARSNTGADGKPILTADRLPLLHEAVVAAWDALDGQEDGLLADPRLCTFDPATIACPEAATDTSACLTPAEVAAVRRFYEGPRDPVTGARLTAGQVMPGSELAWAGVFVPTADDPVIFSEVIALGALQNLVFEENPPAGYTLADLEFTAATFERLRPLHPLYGATDPDLSAFADRGGKLILWHGWSDQHISPMNTIAYHEAVLAEMGEQRAAEFERLYLVPGMYHCSRGEGPSLVDLLTPMMAWVEQGTAPDAIVARQDPAEASGFGQPTAEAAAAVAAQAPAPERSRPVFPFPAVARYDGAGDPNLASSYLRGEPLTSEPAPDWLGANLFRPY